MHQGKVAKEEMNDSSSPPQLEVEKRRDSCLTVITVLMILFGAIPLLLLLVLTLLRMIF